MLSPSSMAPRTMSSTSAAHSGGGPGAVVVATAASTWPGFRDIRCRDGEPGIEHGFGTGKVDDDGGPGIAERARGGEFEPRGAAGAERYGSLDLLSTSR